jgi:hypothetical protein
MKARKGFGLKNGSQQGLKQGGRGRNQTNKCRHQKKEKLSFDMYVFKYGYTKNLKKLVKEIDEW